MSNLATNSLEHVPRDPRSYRPQIGLIGCGGITEHHLTAYRHAGYRVTALCDASLERAEARRAEFYPDARVYDSYVDLLRDDALEVIDIATHPLERVPIVEAALAARKHVLSQKPFVLDLDVGLRLVDLADRQGVRLAVNQNARWAPHFAYTRAALAAGYLGTLSGVHMSVHWDHGWVKGTPFEDVAALILFDYGIHWFDLIQCFFSGRRPLRVFASTARTRTQQVRPDLLGQALLEFSDAQASLAFDGDTPFDCQDRSYLAGSAGSISCVGPDGRQQELIMTTSQQTVVPELKGCWFPDGFHGTMGELLCSIEENRVPTINARENLESLSLCFAAVASAARHEPVVPGTVRSLTA